MKKILVILSLLVLTFFAACLPATPTDGTPSVTTQPGETEPTHTQPKPTETVPAVPSPTDAQLPATPTETQDGGENGPPIVNLAPGEPVSITAIQMVDSNYGWGVGDGGEVQDHILRTVDGGLTWQDISPPEPASTTDQDSKQALSFFLDEDHAWVTYYHPQHELQFEPSKIWFTSDGGGSWEISSPLDTSGVDSFFEPGFLYFADEWHGWLMLGHDRGVGHAPISIYRTGDGGRNWDRIIDPYSEENSGFIQVCCQSGMVFIDSKVGLITSQGGPIESPYIDWTYDGGLNWQEQMLPQADPDLFSRAWCGTVSPVFWPPNSVALIVECIDANTQAGLNIPFLYTSEDQGQTWSFSEMPVPPLAEGVYDYVSRANRVLFLSSEGGWAFVNDVFQVQGEEYTQSLTHIYKTGDGGRTWQEIKSVPWSGQFSYINNQDGWAAARLDTDNALVQTVNEGRTWNMLEAKIGP